MFGIHKIGMWELILILGIVLIIFGPAKLPELGKTMGEAISSFRTGLNKKDKSAIDEETHK